jgi:hypothetical protein
MLARAEIPDSHFPWGETISIPVENQPADDQWLHQVGRRMKIDF